MGRSSDYQIFTKISTYTFFGFHVLVWRWLGMYILTRWVGKVIRFFSVVKKTDLFL